ncbi:MAG TPA: cysteine synthase A [Bacillota bacterium]|nr:cysteine synthase A [Bacillota bacterium]
MNIANHTAELIGKTPLLRLRGIEKAHGLSVRLLAKLESFNPTGSVKDRIALAMVEAAEKEGKLRPGSTIIEPTSGNTGIGLSSVARAKGYRSIIVMPDTMSVERRKLILALGSELVLTEGTKGMRGAIAKAEELAREIDGAFIPSQFENPANPEVHYRTTGPEIWIDTDGQVDWLVSGVGTGGTVSGTGKYLKERNPQIKVAAVEPEASPVLSGGQPGSHPIQGIGAGFVPKTLNREIIDQIICVSGEDALKAAREVSQAEGILVGISSGAALAGALQIAKQEENRGKTVVIIFPDSGERYLSTILFN